MVLDTSALVAVLFDEPSAGDDFTQTDLAAA